MNFKDIVYRTLKFCFVTFRAAIDLTIGRIAAKTLKFYYAFRAKITCGSYQEPLYVNAKSYFTPNTYIGKNGNFNGFQINGGGRVDIGDNFHAGPNCVLITQNHNYDTGISIPYDNTYILKDIVIEDNVWIGHGVIVLGGLRIGEGAIIQAGSVVVSDIPRYALAGGHPAKVFSQRNIEHYEKLKAEGKFC